MIPGKQYSADGCRWRSPPPQVADHSAVCDRECGTVIGTRRLPNRYRSETLILVVPQRVPESYVRSTVTARIEDRLQSISQQILSRTRLERIIQDFNLYRRSARPG